MYEMQMGMGECIGKEGRDEESVERDYLIKISLILPKNGLTLKGKTVFPKFLPKNPTFCLRLLRNVDENERGVGLYL
jgi:hypothetical protein